MGDLFRETYGNTAEFAAIASNARLLAYFPPWFTKMLVNTYSIRCAFCFL
jgi:hypothetical protein